jgi:hypothetical protein
MVHKYTFKERIFVQMKRMKYVDMASLIIRLKTANRNHNVTNM